MGPPWGLEVCTGRLAAAQRSFWNKAKRSPEAQGRDERTVVLKKTSAQRCQVLAVGNLERKEVAGSEGHQRHMTVSLEFCFFLLLNDGSDLGLFDCKETLRSWERLPGEKGWRLGLRWWEGRCRKVSMSSGCRWRGQHRIEVRRERVWFCV